MGGDKPEIIIDSINIVAKDSVRVFDFYEAVAVHQGSVVLKII